MPKMTVQALRLINALRAAGMPRRAFRASTSTKRIRGERNGVRYSYLEYGDAGAHTSDPVWMKWAERNQAILRSRGIDVRIIKRTDDQGLLLVCFFEAHGACAQVGGRLED